MCLVTENMEIDQQTEEPSSYPLRMNDIVNYEPRMDTLTLLENHRTVSTHHSFPRLSYLHSHLPHHISSEEGCTCDFYSGNPLKDGMSVPLQNKSLQSFYKVTVNKCKKWYWAPCDSLRIVTTFLGLPEREHSLSCSLF